MPPRSMMKSTVHFLVLAAAEIPYRCNGCYAFRIEVDLTDAQYLRVCRIIERSIDLSRERVQFLTQAGILTVPESLDRTIEFFDLHVKP